MEEKGINREKFFYFHLSTLYYSWIVALIKLTLYRQYGNTMYLHNKNKIIYLFFLDFIFCDNFL